LHDRCHHFTVGHIHLAAVRFYVKFFHKSCFIIYRWDFVQIIKVTLKEKSCKTKSFCEEEA
jgi:hypothetical protein